MPKIPAQLSRRVMPSVGGGGGARSIANKAGQGMQQAGAAIAAGSAQLGHAFALAQQERDRAERHYRMLEAKTGARSLELEAETVMKQTRDDFAEQLTKAAGTVDRPDDWTVKYEGESGETEFVNAKDAGIRRMNELYNKYLDKAGAMYGPEARAELAQQLGPKAYDNISRYEDSRLKLRHETNAAKFQSVTQKFVDQAADPTNLHRENTKVELADHIAWGARSGFISPMEAEKMRGATKAEIGHKFWTAFAVQNPDKMIDIASKRDGAATPSDGGATTESGALQKLPEDLDPSKVDEYVKLADAQKTRIFSDFERKQKQLAARADAESQVAYSDLISKATREDASLDIEQRRMVLGSRYDDAVKFNHEWNNARRTERTKATTDASQFTQFDLLERAKRAMFVPDLLDPTNPDAITNSVVRQHVTASQDLLPEHAAPILQAISEAQKYQEQEDSGKRQAERDGFKLLERTFTVPQTLDPSSAFTLKRLEQDAYSQLAAEYLKSPQADRNELALNLSAKFTPRVLSIQKARADELDQELLAMEKGFPSGMANAQHKLSDGTRKKMEQQNPILRGLFRLYDAKAERWQQLVEQGQRTAEAETNAKSR